MIGNNRSAIAVVLGTLIVSLAGGAPARAQGSRKDDVVFNAQGRPLAGATVRVCTSAATGQPCSPLAQIYSDAALTQALANPTTADGMGNYNFYAAPGRYEIEISGPGITTKQIPNVLLPSDPVSPTFASVNGVQYASLQTGSDACAKIQAAINTQAGANDALPVVADFATDQTCANLVTVKAGVTLFLNAVKYTWTANCCVVVNTGGHLSGQSSYSGQPATSLTIASGLNPANIVKGADASSGAWHGGIIENLLIDGNKAANTTANCLDVELMGEAGAVQNIEATNCPADGFLINGPNGTTGKLQGLHASNSGTYGFEILSSTGGDLVLQNYGCDNPTTACVHLAPAAGPVTLIGGKVESASGATADPAVLIEGTNGEPQIHFIGLGLVSITGSHSNIFKVQGSNIPPHLTVENLYSANYTNIYNDVTNSKAYTVASVSVDGRVAHWSIGPEPAFYHNALAMTCDPVSLAGGSNNDVRLGNYGDSGCVRVTGPGSAFNITGLLGTVVGDGAGNLDGRVLTVINSVAQPMSFTNEDAGSSAADRIKTGCGATVTIQNQFGAATLQYSAADSRWILLAPNCSAQVIATGTATLTSGAVTSNTCQTAVTVSAPGADPTTAKDAIEWNYQTAAGTADGLMHVSAYVTANNVNFTRCNASSASQTGTAMVINWRVLR